MTGNSMVNIFRMLCVCGDESNVMDDHQQYIDATVFDEVSLYEETNGKKNVQKKFPAPVSVCSYPLDDDCSNQEEEEEDDYIVYYNENKTKNHYTFTSASPTRRSSPTRRQEKQQHQLHKKQASPSHRRTHSSATVTTASMSSVFDDVDDDSSVEFDVSSTMSTEIMRNTISGSYLSSAGSIFRDCSNETNSNNDSSSSVYTLDGDDAKPRGKLIRMTHENYVHRTESRHPPASGERDDLFLLTIPRQFEVHHPVLAESL